MPEKAVDYLIAKISAMQAQHSEAQQRANYLAAQLAAYRDSLRMLQGETDMATAKVESPTASSANGQSEDEDGNNADAVRQFINNRASKGTRPADLNRFFESTKMKVHKNYAYSILARLKRRKEITSRAGKYFPTQILFNRLKPEGEENGALLEFGTQKEAIAEPTAIAS